MSKIINKTLIGAECVERIFRVTNDCLRARKASSERLGYYD